MRAIAICLDRRPAYRDIHRQYVALLAGQGFTPAGRVSSRRQQKRGSGPPGPALERRLKRQVCEWDRERVPWWAVGQAARTGGTIASDIRQRKAFIVWILAAPAA